MGKKLLLLYVFIIWLSISSAGILVLVSNAPGSVCAFWRLFISSLILLPIFIRRKQNIVTIYSILSGLFLSLHFVLWMESLYMIPVVISTVLVVSYPFYNLIIDYLVFKEKISVIQVIGLIIGFSALLAFYHPDISGELNRIGLIYAGLAGFFVSIYFAIGRYLRHNKGIDTINYTFPTYLSASLFALLYNLLRGIDIFSYPLRSYIAFIFLAIIPMMGGHTLMNYLLGKVKTSTITSIALAEPFGAGLLAYVIFNQTISVNQAVLASIVMASVFTIVLAEKVD
ncbi:MAG: EamA family transporter [Staphylothermus sp.]|nr:EamA family transporter [Staphylothermus sp.]